MGCGAKACYEDALEEAHKDHVNRLGDLGLDKIADAVSDLQQSLKSLEGCMTSLPRSGWNQLDRMKEKLKILS